MSEKVTDFSFGYAELNQRGDHMIYLYTRDKEVFLSLGFSATFETEMKDKVEESKSVESDDYWLGVKKMKRATEKNARKVLLRSIDMFQLRTGAVVWNRFARISELSVCRRIGFEERRAGAVCERIAENGRTLWRNDNSGRRDAGLY